MLNRICQIFFCVREGGSETGNAYISVPKQYKRTVTTAKDFDSGHVELVV